MAVNHSSTPSDRFQARSSYAEKLRDPRWQKKRLEILQRDEWKCTVCGDAEQTLHVHHKWYTKGKAPWEYPDICLRTLCDECHGYEHTVRSAKEKDLQDLLLMHNCSAMEIELLVGFLEDYFKDHSPNDLLNLVYHSRTPTQEAC